MTWPGYGRLTVTAARRPWRDAQVTEAELDQLCARRDIWVRRAAIAAIVGVVLYVGGWVSAGMIRPDYDPSERAISELFELGAPWASRGWVVVGLLVSGFGLIAFGPALDRGLPGR